MLVTFAWLSKFNYYLLVIIITIYVNDKQRLIQYFIKFYLRTLIQIKFLNVYLYRVNK